MTSPAGSHETARRHLLGHIENGPQTFDSLVFTLTDILEIAAGKPWVVVA
jgi:hypothetical protein